MLAVLSCIHANEEALRAVLEDIERFPVEDVYCLGDVLGYGPSPVECMDLVVGLPVVLLGNHDAAALHEPDGFGQSAEHAIQLHRRVLAVADRESDNWYTNYLSHLRPSHQEGDTLFVHGSARSPQNEYVFPEDVFNERKMTRIGELSQPLTFCGHTHLPGVFVEQSTGKWEYHHPLDTNNEWRTDGRKTIVNVGSVGQPRDGDWRACYILVDDERIQFRRVEYEVEDTVQKIYATPELDDFLGDRLRDGR